jgi:hypothetical protein
MAALRYVILTTPLAVAGMAAARRFGEPEILGLIAGVLLAAALASAVFGLWLSSVLRTADQRSKIS